MDRTNEGMWAWKQADNNNKMIEMQCREDYDSSCGEVEISYFADMAFQIVTPSGLSILIDPWRNLPIGPNGGDGQWFLHEFPEIQCDIGMSTHAHFDHDALHRLHANMLLDRMVGTFEFADVKITGIADKHVHDWSECLYDFTGYLKSRGIDPAPPNNPRGYDNTIYIIETAGLRIMHWGNNRPDAPQQVWDAIGDIDIAFLPCDESNHILTFPQLDEVIKRHKIKAAFPAVYYIEGLYRMGSTLKPADAWVRGKTDAMRLDHSSISLSKQKIEKMRGQVIYFGNHIAFDLPERRSHVRD